MVSWETNGGQVERQRHAKIPERTSKTGQTSGIEPPESSQDKLGTNTGGREAETSERQI